MKVKIRSLYYFDQVQNFKKRYSGKHRSGICKCGHSWQDHHLGVVVRSLYYRKTKEDYIPQECEYYGFNEYAGLDEKGKDHCHEYIDSKS